MRPDNTIDLTFDRRRMQVMHLTARIMSALDDSGCVSNGRTYQRVTAAILDRLMDMGVDIVTAEDRARAGLPPQGPKGWTDEELRILEAKRIEAMLAPITFPVTGEAKPSVLVMDNEPTRIFTTDDEK